MSYEFIVVVAYLLGMIVAFAAVDWINRIRCSRIARYRCEDCKAHECRARYCHYMRKNLDGKEC